MEDILIHRDSLSISSTHSTHSMPLFNKKNNLNVKEMKLTDGIKPIHPDYILSLIGPSNVYVLLLWIGMGVIWGISALPMMVSAFLISEPCTAGRNCTLQEGSMSKEFNLTGSRTTLADFTTQSFLIGVAIGCCFLPQISDKKGRRTILLISMFCVGFFGTLSAMAPDIYSFIVLRFLQGLFFTGCGITNWILAYESIPMQLRSYTLMVFGLFWVIGYTIVAPLAYLLETWRKLVFCISVPIIFLTVLFYFIVPESFHYLVTRRRKKSIIKWINNANYFGNSTKALDAESFCENLYLTDNIKKVEENCSKSFFWHLSNNRSLLLNLIVLAYLWICDTFIYYGLSLFSTQLAGNRYVNFSLIGLIEIPSYIVAPFLLDKWGRKYFVSLCHFLAAISFIGILFFESGQMHLAMWLIGKLVISASFTSLFVYGSEIFPTIVRNRCVGLCEVLGRLGGVFAPNIMTAKRISPILPTIIFAVFAGIAATVTLVLPETKNKKLPDLDEDLPN